MEWDERDPTATILDLIEVYTVKFDANGIYTKHKNRVAAGGHRSVSGKDYDHGHVDGVGAEEIRLFGALAATSGKSVWSGDIATAYLNALTKVLIYVWPPSFVRFLNMTDTQLARVLSDIESGLH